MGVSSEQFRVYRSGPPEPPVHGAQIARLYVRIDALCPVGRTGRGAALFCAPTLFGASRWLRANLATYAAGTDVGVRELRITAEPPVFAYPVQDWERVSSSSTSDTELQSYWLTGVPLAHWLERAPLDGLDAREWDVLVPLSAVLGVSPIADKEVLASIPVADWSHKALADELERARR